MLYCSLANSLAIAIHHPITENGIGIRSGGEPPPTKAEDSVNTGEVEQTIELILVAANIHFPVRCDVGKGPMNVCIVIITLEL